MIKKRPTPLLLSITLFSLFLVTGNSQAGSQKVITDDGHEVLLNDDGSWTFRTPDRFTSTSDGRRIRLKDDGSWQYANDLPPAADNKKQTPDPDVKLEKVIIEKYVKKGFKNTRVKTQTIFYVQLENFQQPAISSADMSLIEVKDSNGKNYPVISIKPGTTASIVIRAEKSPSILDDARSMEITLKAGVFGLRRPITLSMRTVDFDKKEVDGFE